MELFDNFRVVTETHGILKIATKAKESRQMEALAYPCIVMASIIVFVGFYHLYIFIRRRRPLVHLPFALLCFCVALYDVFCIGLYNSQSTAEGVIWQKLQINTVFLIPIFVIWFVTIFIEQKSKRTPYFLMGWFLCLFLISWFLSPELTLSPFQPATKYINLFGTPITYFEAEIGPFFNFTTVSAILAYVYLIVQLLRWYGRVRQKSGLIIIAGLVAYFLGVTNDAAVAAGLYEFVYLSEYTFMIIILGMSYVLLNEFISLYGAVEEANRDLETKIRTRTHEIELLNNKLRLQAELDPLTGIYNRRFFSEYLEIELRRALNRIEHKTLLPQNGNDMNFGLAIIDVDHFKRVNDNYGHPIGDQVLLEIVRTIQATIFSRDIFCRYGGEEFVVMFTRTSGEGIVNAVEKIRRNVQDQVIELPDGLPPLHITVSIGAAILNDVSTPNSDEFLKLADKRLLIAKESGRNRIVCS